MSKRRARVDDEEFEISSAEFDTDDHAKPHKRQRVSKGALRMRNDVLAGKVASSSSAAKPAKTRGKYRRRTLKIQPDSLKGRYPTPDKVDRGIGVAGRDNKSNRMLYLIPAHAVQAASNREKKPGRALSPDDDGTSDI